MSGRFPSITRALFRPLTISTILLLTLSSNSHFILGSARSQGSTVADVIVWPSARADHAMAYDGQSDRIILFGGRGSGGPYAETWTYDLNANAWSNMHPAASPSERANHAMAYDAASDRIIHFGGRVPSLIGSDGTWSYDTDANSWTERNASSRPPSRMEHAMAYDAESDRIIMFGGAAGTVGGGIGTVFNDAWAYEFDTNVWTRMNTPTRPSGRQAHP